MNHLFSLLVRTASLLVLLVFAISSPAQEVELILQKGHESSPVQAAAISPDNAILVTVDKSGKVISWDIATGLQLDEVHTTLFSECAIQFDPSNNRSVWIDNKKNQLIALDFGTRRAGKGFWGKSLDCLKEDNSFSMATQQIRVDPCNKLGMVGSFGAQKEHYFFVTEFNEVFISKVSKNEINQSFDNFYWPSLEPKISVSNNGNPSDYLEDHGKLGKSKSSKIGSPKSKVSKSAPSKSKIAEPTPQVDGRLNNAIKTFRGLGGKEGKSISLNQITPPETLVYNEASKRIAFRNPFSSEFVLADVSGQSIRTINSVSYNIGMPTWLSPAADYFGVVKGKDFLWVKLEDGSQTIITTDNSRPVSQLKVFPEQNLFLVERRNGQIELYDFEKKEVLFKKRLEKGTSAITISDDGKYLVTFHNSKGVYLWNVQHAALVRAFNAGIPEAFQMQLSDDESQLLVLSGNREVYSLQMGGSFAYQSLLPPEEEVNKVRFSPGGETMIWVKKGEGRTLQVRQKAKEQSIRFNRSFQIDQFYFSPDGAHFAVTSNKGQIEVFQTNGLNKLAEFPALGYEINHMAIHPKRSLLAVAYKDRIKLADWEKEPPSDWDKETSDGTGQLEGIQFSVDKMGGMSRPSSEDGLSRMDDAGDLIYVEFSETGDYLILRGGPQAGILKVSENNELNRLYPDPKWRREGLDEKIFAMGLINKAFGSSIYSPQFLNNDRSILFEGKNETIEIWDFTEVSQHLVNFEGNRDAFTGKPLYTIDTEGIIYESFLVMETKPIIIFNCGNDGIFLFNYQTEEFLAALFPVNEEKMLIINPENYYFSTSRGYDMLAFKQGEKIYPLEQFDLQYNRPDIVLEGIGLSSDSLVSAYYKAYQKRLGKLNFSEDMFGDEFSVPELELLTSDIPSSTTQSNLQLSVRATDPLEKLDRLNVYVNDVPVNGRNGIDLKLEDTNMLEKLIDLGLSVGQNKIQVSVLNQAGRESLKETVYISYQNNEARPNLYFIGLGVSDYKNQEKNLKYAVKDVVDLASLLEKDSVNFNEVYIHQFTDQEVTLDNLDAIKDLLMRTDINDRVILFYAGHGVFDSELNYFLASHDVDFENPQNKGIPYEAFENLLDGIPARFKLSLMDACHSGEIDKDNVEKIEANLPEEGDVLFRSTGVGLSSKRVGLQNSFELMKEIFVDLRRITGTTTISSAGGVEFAVEGTEWNNSVFTYSFLKGLKERSADLDQDGDIMVSELQQYLADEVQRLTNGGQRPTMRLENIANDWRVW